MLGGGADAGVDGAGQRAGDHLRGGAQAAAGDAGGGAGGAGGVLGWGGGAALCCVEWGVCVGGGGARIRAGWLPAPHDHLSALPAACLSSALPLLHQIFHAKHAARANHSERYISGNTLYFRMNRILDIYFVGGFGTVQVCGVVRWVAVGAVRAAVACVERREGGRCALWAESAGSAAARAHHTCALRPASQPACSCPPPPRLPLTPCASAATAAAAAAVGGRG